MTAPGRVTVMAGRVNAHTHVYSALAPFGMPAPREQPQNFPQILERVWWRLDRALDEPSLSTSARLYAAEALLHGTTTLVDHHESPSFIEGSLDVIADACQELGIRAVLTFGATERNGGREEARRGLAECRRFIRDNRRPLVRGLVGLHASFTVSDETVREAGDLCRELRTALHVHLAEDVCDGTDAARRGFAGPLERLLELGALPPGSLAAHGVHLSEAQVRRVEACQVWLIQNPRSNRGNGVGYPLALRASRRVALGTDGYPSDLFAELEALVDIARAYPDREPGGAADLGRRLESGCRLAAERFAQSSLDADCVELAPAEPGNGTRARRVTVDGRVVVEEGRLVHGDIDEIRARAREEAQHLWKRMEAL